MAWISSNSVPVIYTYQIDAPGFLYLYALSVNLFFTGVTFGYDVVEKG